MLLKPFGKYLVGNWVGNLLPIAARWMSARGSSSSSCDSNSPSKSKCKGKGKDRPEPSCKRSVKKKDCSKVPTPFPSYSECKRKPTDPKPSKECDCWDCDKC